MLFRCIGTGSILFKGHVTKTTQWKDAADLRLFVEDSDELETIVFEPVGDKVEKRMCRVAVRQQEKEEIKEKLENAKEWLDNQSK